jgi:hypothetical protein
MKEVKKFSRGEEVRWRSQAGGSWKQKQGLVIQVIDAGSRPSPHVLKGCGWQRDHESYIVRVDGKNYWPRVTALSR